MGCCLHIGLTCIAHLASHPLLASRQAAAPTPPSPGPAARAAGGGEAPRSPALCAAHAAAAAGCRWAAVGGGWAAVGRSESQHGQGSAVWPQCRLLLHPSIPPAGAPEVLQAAGLRLLCRLWHASGGRAYPQLRAAVIGEQQARQQDAPMECRLTCPASLCFPPARPCQPNHLAAVCRVCAAWRVAGAGAAAGAGRVPARHCGVRSR